MPDPETTFAKREAMQDSAVLHLLVNDGSHRRWAVDEVARELHRDVTDNINRLHGGGLIHRLEGFIRTIACPPSRSVPHDPQVSHAV
jgi:hypothetical protein